MSGKAVQGYLNAPPKELIPITETPPENASVHDGPLRAIATALEALDVHEFDLTCEGRDYVVTVKSWSKNDGVWRRLLGYLWPSRYRLRPNKLVYTPEDIEKLQLEGKARRHNKSTDPHKLTQALRAIGFYIDSKKARLSRISTNGELMTTEYSSPQEGRKTEEFTVSSLYGLFVQMYLKRRDRRRAQKVGE